MSFLDWVNNTVTAVRNDGMEGVSDSLYEFYLGMWRRWNYFSASGECIYEEDWDVLVILDGCRYDLLSEVVKEDEYDIFDTIGPFRSQGTDSGTWMQNNFNERFQSKMEETVIVTGNPHSDWLLDDHQFLELDEVWRYAWDEELQTIPPRPLTDRAIKHSREASPEHLVVHYMQPHYPFLSEPLGEGVKLDGFGDPTNTVWERLRKGELDRKTVWSAYKQNLRDVLDDVKLLLQNCDADSVVVSSDHGNALGEKGIYGHPSNVPLEVLLKVPWCETTANDSGEYTPTTERTNTSADVEARLRQLGYK